MTRFVSFFIPGKPVPKARARRGKFGNWYTPDETEDFEIKAASSFLALGIGQPRHKGGVRLSLVVTPAGIQVAAELLDAPAPKLGFDLDNVLKSVADALNGVLFVDDSQIVGVILEAQAAVEKGITQ